MKGCAPSIARFPVWFFWTSGSWDYPALWAAIALYVTAKGSGRFGADRLIGREI